MSRRQDGPGAVDATGAASAASAAVTQLCGGLAHDFGNLLTVLRGSLHLLELETAIAENGDLASLVQAARSAADEAALRIRGLALLAGTAPAAHQAVDLNALVRRLEPRFAELLGTRVRTGLVLADDLAPVTVDPTDLEAALLALLLNARNAIAGDGTVTLTTRRTGRAGRDGQADLCLEVTDTGRGMSAEALATALAPLATTRPRAKTAGLGLAIVERAMARSGGRVDLRSTPEAGTTVTLHLRPA